MKADLYGHHCNSISDYGGGGGDGTESQSRLLSGSNNNDADARRPLAALVGIPAGDGAAACGYFYVERGVFLLLSLGSAQGSSWRWGVGDGVGGRGHRVGCGRHQVIYENRLLKPIDSVRLCAITTQIGKDQKVPVVIMPGDNVPKFIALPCPCEPPRPEEPDKHVIRQLTRPQKPPPLAIPLYV
ncbi:hypothetical protein AKJ16_DCAP11698 [Drosera capensis]